MNLDRFEIFSIEKKKELKQFDFLILFLPKAYTFQNLNLQNHFINNYPIYYSHLYQLKNFMSLKLEIIEINCQFIIQNQKATY